MRNIARASPRRSGIQIATAVGMARPILFLVLCVTVTLAVNVVGSTVHNWNRASRLNVEAAASRP
jgi:hypothetical protein